MYTELSSVVFDNFADAGILAVKFRLQELHLKSGIGNKPARLQFDRLLSLGNYRIHNVPAPNDRLRKRRKDFLQRRFNFTKKAHIAKQNVKIKTARFMPIKGLTIKQMLNTMKRMKMVATRELATNSGKVMKEVDKSGFVVITKDGKPRSILISTTEDTLLPDVRAVVHMKFKQMLLRSQMRAVKNGTSNMTMEEIDAEIAAARKERKNRK